MSEQPAGSGTEAGEEFGAYVEPEEGQDHRQTQFRRPGRDLPPAPTEEERADDSAD